MWPDGDGPDLLVDDGGDATLLIHEGVDAEEAFAKDGTLPDPESAESREFGHAAPATQELKMEYGRKNPFPATIKEA